MSDCIIREFNGCDCVPGECRSATVPIIKVISAHDARVERDRALASINNTRTWAIALAGCLLIFSIAAFVGQGHSAQQARVNQEQVVTWNR